MFPTKTCFGWLRSPSLNVYVLFCLYDIVDDTVGVDAGGGYILKSEVGWPSKSCQIILELLISAYSVLVIRELCIVTLLHM